MKIIILILSILLQYLPVLSQNYIEYNKDIIKAQMKILESDYDSSKYYYTIAFKKVSKPFPKDILNLANVYFYTDSIEICKKYIKKAIINGAYYKFVKKRFKKKIRNVKFWNECKILSEDYIFNQKQDSLYKILFEMINNDQQARKSIFNKKEKMIFTDSVNYNKLSRILTPFFYPGYQSVGTYLSMDIVSVLLLHFKYPDYKNIIINGLTKGEITPYMAAFIYTRQYKSHNNNSCPISLPELIKETLRIYKGNKYKQVLKKGFNFNYHL